MKLGFIKHFVKPNFTAIKDSIFLTCYQCMTVFSPIFSFPQYCLRMNLVSIEFIYLFSSFIINSTSFSSDSYQEIFQVKERERLCLSLKSFTLIFPYCRVYHLALNTNNLSFRIYYLTLGSNHFFSASLN